MREENPGAAWVQMLRDYPHGLRHPEAPCVGCGVLTGRRAILAVAEPINDHIAFVERAPWCARCEAGRNRRQLEQIAANDAVLPRLREDARQQLAAMEAAVVAA